MKNPLLFISFLAIGSFAINAQTIVNTGADSKHVILEEFSGVKCVACPSGHATAAAILQSNPGVVHLVSYAPGTTHYTDPVGTQAADFRRDFASSLWSASYCSQGTGTLWLPSAFINRKVLNNGNILQSRSTWTGHVNNTLQENAPVNIGLKSTYNASAQTLTIDVELYYVSDINLGNVINVLITEDNLPTYYQSGTSASPSNPYYYDHVFRERVSFSQWGDPVLVSTTQGNLFTKQYTFDLSTAIDPINIANAHVVAFVTNTNANKEVYTGISVQADGGQASTGKNLTSVDEIINSDGIKVYPNPTNSTSTISFHLNENAPVNVEIFNSIGELVFSDNEVMSKGAQTVVFDGNELPQGLYFTNLTTGEQVITRKVLLLK